MLQSQVLGPVSNQALGQQHQLPVAGTGWKQSGKLAGAFGMILLISWSVLNPEKLTIRNCLLSDVPALSQTEGLICMKAAVGGILYT